MQGLIYHLRRYFLYHLLNLAPARHIEAVIGRAG